MEEPPSAKLLQPIPGVVHRGLTAITTAAFLSVVTTTLLLLHMLYRLTTSKFGRYGARINQYVVLLLNLIFADLQTGVGFSLSAKWLQTNSIVPLTPTCWAQGILLNAGDVGCAFFTAAIASHLFADIVFDYRLSYTPFLVMIIGIWMIDWIFATVGIVAHGPDFYMRAGSWCWINEKYLNERLWYHYLWIVAAQFIVVVAYTLMFVVLWRRVRTFFYSTTDTRLRAESAARAVLAYPIIYVLCTLPATCARLRTMAGGSVGYNELSFVGTAITSIGWLDVLLYVITRRTLIFGPAISNEDATGLDTFSNWAVPRQEWLAKAPSETNTSRASNEGPYPLQPWNPRLPDLREEGEGNGGEPRADERTQDSENTDVDAITPVPLAPQEDHENSSRRMPSPRQSFAHFERSFSGFDKLEQV